MSQSGSRAALRATLVPPGNMSGLNPFMTINRVTDEVMTTRGGTACPTFWHSLTHQYPTHQSLKRMARPRIDTIAHNAAQIPHMLRAQIGIDGVARSVSQQQLTQSGTPPYSRLCAHPLRHRVRFSPYATSCEVMKPRTL